MTIRRYPIEPFPTSWYRILDAGALQSDAVVRVSYFGRDLVAFRDVDGHPQVLDAYCAHLGANLGVGGRVEDGHIICPFHEWRFDGRGTCVAIPYSDHIPPKAEVRAYPAREVNGMIVVYYEARGRQPTWEVPEIPGYFDVETWTPHVSKSWTIRTHIQEIVENGADAAHAVSVHGAREVPTMKFRSRGPYWHGTFDGRYDVEVDGQSMGEVVLDGVLEQIGLGFAHTETKTAYSGLDVTHQSQSCFTPVDEDHMEFTLVTRTLRLEDDELTKMVADAMTVPFQQVVESDIPIWENKIYRHLPSRSGTQRLEAPARLCRADRTIAQVRRWSRQFYSDASGLV
jgi:3-ketosteroid 9alpha-monooxygenase subunit A